MVWDGRLCYGMYRGPVDPDSPFIGKGCLGFIRHGWVEMPGGDIFDPTRWVFDRPHDPYIYEGPPGKDYDFGMEAFRGLLHRLNPTPCPPFDPKGKSYPFPESEGLTYFVKAVCHIPPDATLIGLAQVFWLANRVPRQLGENVTPVFQWIASLGKKAFIPIDFQERYLNEDSRDRGTSLAMFP